MKADFFRALEIMARYRAHDAVRDCLELANRLLEQTGDDLIVITDLDLVVVDLNSAMSRYLGRPKHKVVGCNASVLFLAHSLKQVPSIMASMSCGKAYTFLAVGRHGEKFNVTASPIMNESGQVDRIFTRIRVVPEPVPNDQQASPCRD